MSSHLSQGMRDALLREGLNPDDFDPGNSQHIHALQAANFRHCCGNTYCMIEDAIQKAWRSDLQWLFAVAMLLYMDGIKKCPDCSSPKCCLNQALWVIQSLRIDFRSTPNL